MAATRRWRCSRTATVAPVSSEYRSMRAELPAQVTPRGRKLRDDPVSLWWHLAEHLPPAKVTRLETHAGLLLLAAVAAGSAAGDDPLEYVARMLGEAGWANRDGVTFARAALRTWPA